MAIDQARGFQRMDCSKETRLVELDFSACPIANFAHELWTIALT